MSRGYSSRDFQVSYRMGPQRQVAQPVAAARRVFDAETSAAGYSRAHMDIVRQFAVEPSVSLNPIVLPQGRSRPG